MFGQGLNFGGIAGSLEYLIDYLVLAGGGSGGGIATSNFRGSGGGGAGGAKTSFTSTRDAGIPPLTPITPTVGTVYTISVGGGGPVTAQSQSQGSNGTGSSITATGLSITTAGGGIGSTNYPNFNQATSGGCGGGGSSNFTGYPGKAGTSGEGYDGGSGIGAGYSNEGCGGGGTFEVGQIGRNTSQGKGGSGLQSSITGTPTYYGEGGMGSRTFSFTPNTSLNGIGGVSFMNSRVTPAYVFEGSALTNSGSGGAGGFEPGNTLFYPAIKGGGGGSGVVILRIPTSHYSGTQTGASVSTDEDYTILTYNGSGNYTG